MSCAIFAMYLYFLKIHRLSEIEIELIVLYRIWRPYPCHPQIARDQGQNSAGYSTLTSWGREINYTLGGWIDSGKIMRTVLKDTKDFRCQKALSPPLSSTLLFGSGTLLE